MNVRKWLDMAVVMALAGFGSLALASPWPDHVVWRYDNGIACYTNQGAGNNMTIKASLDGAWDDPETVLGKPNTLSGDENAPGGGNFRKVSMVWPALKKGTDNASLYNTSYQLGSVYATYNGCGVYSDNYSDPANPIYEQIVVEFTEPIVNDPNNPYGIDLIVHGNAFFASGSSYLNANSNMDACIINGSVDEEPVTISVAQSLEGPWYTFTAAPGAATVTGDNYFPTQPWKWDSTLHCWTGEQLDWQKPVNPWIRNYFVNRTVADAIRLYAGSAGGTPLDLDWLRDSNGNPVNLPWIKYVKFTDPDCWQGEICGLARTVPVKIGDGMSVAPENVSAGASRLVFTDTDNASKIIAQVQVNNVSNISQISIGYVDNLTAYPSAAGQVLSAYSVTAQSIPNPAGTVTITADLGLFTADNYTGTGNDLAIYRWNGTAWDILPAFTYNPQTKILTVQGLTGFSVFTITRTVPSLIGDLNNDNRITSADVSILLPAMDAVPNASNWNPQADLDGDGEVTSTDMSMLLKNVEQP